MDEKAISERCSMNTCREVGVCLMESNCQSVSIDDAQVEAVAKALAGEEWEATSFLDTLAGDDPEEMREYWRDKARSAILALKAFGGDDSTAPKGREYEEPAPLVKVGD